MAAPTLRARRASVLSRPLPRRRAQPRYTTTSDLTAPPVGLVHKRCIAVGTGSVRSTATLMTRFLSGRVSPTRSGLPATH
jgi:hypothetical protein